MFDISVATNPKLSSMTITPPAPHRPFQHHEEASACTAVYRCHTDRVKRIATEASSHVFLTCGEDGTVRCASGASMDCTAVRLLITLYAHTFAGNTTLAFTTTVGLRAFKLPAKPIARSRSLPTRRFRSTRSRCRCFGHTSLSWQALHPTPISVSRVLSIRMNEWILELTRGEFVVLCYAGR